MDRYTAAQMGQNIASIGDAFMQMNDPRTRAQAEALRLGIDGQKATNAGLLLKNQYSPKLYESQIGQNNASAAANTAQGGFYDAQTAGQGIQNTASKQLLDSVGSAFGPAPVPQLPVGFETALASDAELGMLLPPLNNGPQAAMPDGIAPAAPYPVATGQPGGVAQAFSPLDLAILASVQSGGGAADMTAGAASAMGMGANSELAARQALLGQGKVMGQGEYFMPSGSDNYQARDIAGQLTQTQMQEQGLNLRKSADIVAGPGGRASSAAGGSLGSAGKNPLDLVAGAEFTAKASAQRFGLVSESGEAVIDPTMRAASTAWESSVVNLTESGVPIQQAVSIADQHHNIGGIERVGGGWFSGDERMEAGTGFNPTSITPDAARQFGASYAGSAPGGDQTGGAARLFAAGMLNPAIAQMAAPQAPIDEPSPAAVPFMLQRPADPIPSTGPQRASDAFKPREGSSEKKAREKKEAKISELQAGISKLTQRLQSGKVSTPAMPSYMTGGMAAAFAPARPTTTQLSNDGFNANRKALMQMEAELEALLPSAAPTPATPTAAPAVQVGRFQVTSH